MTGRLSAASTVYSFGVVLLEMITGRRAFVGQAAEMDDRNIVTWALPFWKDKRKLLRMADPALLGRYPSKNLERALAVAFVCVQQDPARRPPIRDVVTALVYLASDRSS